ncbi:MAG TPA: hypothetical protein VMW50_08200 [Dehalococcoidia bacterium]|nr:hypothetical protein [Dehalococcoidia bacterium]
MSNHVIPEDNNENQSAWPEIVDPVAASGVRLTNATANTDTETTVVEGGVYVFTSLIAGGFYFGLAAVTTEDNVRWVAPLYRSIIIRIPLGGGTSLHYATDTTNGIGYLRRLS